ncbi:uncharacterized protein BX663DRAFT_511189 [Cokeromyces recurvatus]|uniref:uncharacterized protein n=1 Tax=Cokeromyces recurvatus TaxID=90255 RepID=UPI00221EA797|nr:uncharacterized protein BX663DRAFT_511189 [Cokeromyces recurvatus]KAI7902475.1 hypothetical protein BX663DRAFT_511189 [Cokeromyces recurvatus]
MNGISDFLEKHQQGARFTLTAIAASALTTAALLSYQKYINFRLEKEENNNTSSFLNQKAIKEKSAIQHSNTIDIIDEEDPIQQEPERKKSIDETLVLELLARNIAFFGAEGVSKIRQSFIVVVGSGAVGSWTALMLVRSGVEHIRIIDSGRVRFESLTRHAVAKVTDVGKSKSRILKKYLADIAPQANVESLHAELTEDNISKMLAGNPDFVVDTLSHVKDKILLAKYCKEHNIKIVSAMSAGLKADPTLVQVTDVSDSVSDPLARMYRRQLRKFDIACDLPIVYSIEKNINIDKDVADFRTRSLPVLGPVASMFGMALVTYILVQLADFTAYKLPANKMRDGVYTRLQKELASREEFIFKNKNNILNTKDVGYIFDELWKGKSVISGAQDRSLVMTRWDTSKESSILNTVVMTKEEANLHDKLPQGTDLVAHYGRDVVERIEEEFRLERKLQELWDSCQ